MYSYVAIRSDESYREGLKSKKNIETILPFREDHIDKKGVIEILENAGLGLPKYYEWRSRSGCYFCFFQRQSEWLGLKRNHPELFAKAREIEKSAGDGYTWVRGKNLD